MRGPHRPRPHPPPTAATLPPEEPEGKLIMHLSPLLCASTERPLGAYLGLGCQPAVFFQPPRRSLFLCRKSTKARWGGGGCDPPSQQCFLSDRHDTPGSRGKALMANVTVPPRTSSEDVLSSGTNIWFSDARERRDTNAQATREPSSQPPFPPFMSFLPPVLLSPIG